MVRTFDDAWGYTGSIGSVGSYTKEELELFWEALMETPDMSSYCEIGCSEGRSTSLILQAAIDKNCNLIVIDSFEEGGPEVASRFMRNILPLRWAFILSISRSETYADAIQSPVFDLVHIDGGHEAEVVTKDCLTFLPSVRPGGFAVFHDYGNDGLPAVTEAVNSTAIGDLWDKFGLVNHCLVLRRLG